ncbi:adenylosuccinate synthase [Haliangium sp.]|uniref:adenylosuccinate synthase n=1 Tax=Haliangium sp. TaxID=2663208 RepID=UPI003D0AB7BC
MSVVVVVGAQWGDEGKGKVVDRLAEAAEVVVRFGGGANAGHTLVIDGAQLVTHLIPSGVLHRGTRCVLGDGMVVDPDTLLAEIDACRQRGLLADDELLISERAHVILPYHRTVEALREERRRHAIGTTRRGIGPAYEAKAGRRGVRMRDLLRPGRLAELVDQNLDELAAVITHYGGEVPDPAARAGIVDAAARAGERLARHITNTGRAIDEAIRAGRNVLFEGAQGALLDLDHGTYPFVTSSSTVAAGACQGAGVGPTCIDQVIGISKAYVTRVGGGPFPTELGPSEAEALRQAGGEFGATTGRPRRCGWLDLPALRLAVRINGLSGLALTKLDVLTGQAELAMCTHYRLDGDLLDELPTDPEDIERAEPVWQRFPGWQDDLRDARTLADLPAAARRYVGAIEEAAGVPLVLVSVGPDRGHTIELQKAFP